MTHAIAITNRQRLPITISKSQAFPAEIAMKSQFYKCFRSRSDFFELRLQSLAICDSKSLPFGSPSTFKDNEFPRIALCNVIVCVRMGGGGVGRGGGGGSVRPVDILWRCLIYDFCLPASLRRPKKTQSQKLARTAPKNFLNNSRGVPVIAH